MHALFQDPELGVQLQYRGNCIWRPCFAAPVISFRNWKLCMCVKGNLEQPLGIFKKM